MRSGFPDGKMPPRRSYAREKVTKSPFPARLGEPCPKPGPEKRGSGRFQALAEGLVIRLGQLKTAGEKDIGTEASLWNEPGQAQPS